MKSRKIIERRKKNKVERKNYKWVSLFLLLFIIVLILALYFVKSNTSKPVDLLNIKKDDTFQFNQSKGDQFFYLIFSLNSDNRLQSNIILYEKDSDKYFEVPTDIYIKYDEKYYLLSNIINVIKQNRSESANKNFLEFIQNLIGIKISDYAFSYDNDQKTYYTNNITNNWQSLIQNAKDLIKLDSTNEIINENRNLKIYSEESNDYILRKENNSHKNIKIELYNSTNLNGLGNTYSRLLQNCGFSVVRVLNYDRIYPNSVLLNNGNTSEGDEILKQILNIDKVDTRIPSDINTVADYVVILGGDSINLY